LRAAAARRHEDFGDWKEGKGKRRKKKGKSEKPFIPNYFQI
jgi:hypothetical protein